MFGVPIRCRFLFIISRKVYWGMLRWSLLQSDPRIAEVEIDKFQEKATSINFLRSLRGICVDIRSDASLFLQRFMSKKSGMLLHYIEEQCCWQLQWHSSAVDPTNGWDRLDDFYDKDYCVYRTCAVRWWRMTSSFQRCAGRVCRLSQRTFSLVWFFRCRSLWWTARGNSVIREQEERGKGWSFVYVVCSHSILVARGELHVCSEIRRSNYVAK